MTIQYSGGNYCGFQVQTGRGDPTVQGTLEAALYRLTGERVKVFGSGRTDAGVHARGQVVNFHTDFPIPSEKYCLALAAYLPPDIIVKKSEEAPEDFHSRYDAAGKCYSFRIYNGKRPDIFWQDYAETVRGKLDREKMAEALHMIRGSHDFRAFTPKKEDAMDFCREIFSAEMTESSEEPLLTIKICGSGFMYHMVRMIAGGLIHVGLGRLEQEDFKKALETGQRDIIKYTAAAHGLTLEKVWYKGEMT